MSARNFYFAVFATFILTNIGWAQTSERSVAVGGTATVLAEPDLARLSMAVIERNLTLSVAQQSAGNAVGTVLDVLKSHSIERKHINTTAALIRADYKWNRDTEEQELRGYIVERRISVTLHDLDKLGSLIEQLTGAGISQLSPPQLDSSTRRELHREALANALTDARANAESLAKASGNTLGRALSISTAGTAPPPRPMMRAQAGAMLAESADESYLPGEIRIDARINVVYELTD